jgi:hypothetical protein
MFKMSLEYMYKEHKATLDAHNQASSTPNGTQMAARQKIGRKHPKTPWLVVRKRTIPTFYWF